MDWLGNISEKTLIPLGIVILLVGGVNRIVQVEGQVQANSDRINRQGEAVKEANKTLDEINQRLSRIEGKLGIH